MPVQRQLTRVYINPSIRAAFQAQFPGTGSLSWVLETAMAEVLKVTSGSPDTTELVRSLIKSAILRERRDRKELADGQRRTKPAALATATIERIDG